MAKEKRFVCQGMPVIWHENGNRLNPPYAAIITEVGDTTIGLSIFSPTSHNMMIRDGVRHISDRSGNEANYLESGAWDYTDEYYRLNQLRKEVAALQEKYEKPEKK